MLRRRCPNGKDSSRRFFSPTWKFWEQSRDILALRLRELNIVEFVVFVTIGHSREVSVQTGTSFMLLFVGKSHVPSEWSSKTPLGFTVAQIAVD